MLLLSFLLQTGCAPPPAPENLEELCKYIFTHTPDEKDTELVNGLENLHDWIIKGDHLDNTIEGYQVNNLEQESLDSLSDKSRSIGDNLIGAAVGYNHEYSMKKIIRAAFVAPWEEVVDNTYDSYDREFEENPSCLLNKDCTWLEYETNSVSTWVGLITVESYNKGQVRWVETDYGWMNVQRTWLVNPADVSGAIENIEVNANYFIGVVMPTKKGIVRISATWIDTDYGSLPVSEDWAKSQVVDQMQEQNRDIEKWLDDR
ncbi:MAG: hypothetical protein VX026_01590 [Myxococcota bacterium]|nr:hypothetical protein [Myxococcota bacterium]